MKNRFSRLTAFRKILPMLKENAKMIAGAVATLVVLLLKPYVPELASPEIQPAIEIVIGALIVAASVWLTPTATSGAGPSSPPSFPTGRR